VRVVALEVSKAENTKDWWNARYEAAGESGLFSKQPSDFLTQFMDLIPKGGSVVDLACVVVQAAGAVVGAGPAAPRRGEGVDLADRAQGLEHLFDAHTQPLVGQAFVQQRGEQQRDHAAQGMDAHLLIGPVVYRPERDVSHVFHRVEGALHVVLAAVGIRDTQGQPSILYPAPTSGSDLHPAGPRDLGIDLHPAGSDLTLQGQTSTTVLDCLGVRRW